ncbi:hypothetical protein KUTeg_019924 [Tegillarca granosa]|uniref:VWFC domain-containing protein n=1 Tax=Tegillarca granosa TaxID=220873 RepID=A0ABQ9EDZ8_TEGGR|nr:hypothetical protein KUTeg_019924 [Tegillarca granosa]
MTKHYAIFHEYFQLIKSASFSLNFTQGGRISGGGCMYEGQVYQQGQTWTKQCQVNCVCQDGTTGLYKCTDICPSYGTLPKQCHMVQQPNSCCSKPECSFQASTNGGDGQGTIMTNGGQNGMGTMISGGTTCQNKINNCENYGQSVCTNTQYAQWVVENCPAYCNKCKYTNVEQ